MLRENNKFWDKTDFWKISGFDHSWFSVAFDQKGQILKLHRIAKISLSVANLNFVISQQLIPGIFTIVPGCKIGLL